MSQDLEALIEQEVSEWQIVRIDRQIWNLVSPVGYVTGLKRFPNEEAVKRWIRRQAEEAVKKKIKDAEF